MKFGVCIISRFLCWVNERCACMLSLSFSSEKVFSQPVTGGCMVRRWKKAFLMFWCISFSFTLTSMDFIVWRMSLLLKEICPPHICQISLNKWYNKKCLPLERHSIQIGFFVGLRINKSLTWLISILCTYKVATMTKVKYPCSHQLSLSLSLSILYTCFN